MYNKQHERIAYYISDFDGDFCHHDDRYDNFYHQINASNSPNSAERGGNKSANCQSEWNCKYGFNWRGISQKLCFKKWIFLKIFLKEEGKKE